MFIAAPAFSWTLSWEDVTGEDSYRVSYKDYPAGYSYENQAPESLIRDMAGATTVSIPADTVTFDLPAANFIPGNRYVFAVQAIKDGSVSGYSDFPCWTWPTEGNVIEMPVDSTGNIQINIYQVPR